MKKLISFLLIVSTFLACSSTGLEPVKSPEEIIKEAMLNSSEFRSGTFSVDLDGEMENTILEQEIDLDVTISGTYDSRDLDDPKLALVMNLLGHFDEGEEQKIEFEMRFLSEQMYLVLNDISDFDGQVPLPLVQGFLKQWWSIPMPKDDVQSATLKAFYENSDDPTSIALKEMYLKHFVFKDLKYTGNENVNGEAAYVYSWTLDKDAFVEYMQGVGDVLEQPLTEEEMSDTKTFLESIEVKGEMYISQDELILVKTDGEIEINELEGVSATFDFQYEVADWDQNVKIEVPEGATEFNPAALMGGTMPEGEEAAPELSL